jgi:glycosyltransferase involved in cell wall biosynthesis
MPRQALVSVVIPAYNAESFIDDALRSLLGQTYPNLEIIVVDDASTDGTAARVAAYAPRVRCIRDTHSYGSAGAPRNTGIRHSIGEYIAFLDADDVLLPDRIQRQVEFLSGRPGVELVFSDYRNFSTNGPADSSHFQTCPRLQKMLAGGPSLILTGEEAATLLAQENFGISGTFMIRRTLLRLEGGFDPTLRACEDFHFYFRATRHGQVGVINEVGMMRRLHAANMTSNPVRMLSEGIRSRSMLRDCESNWGIRAHLDRYIAVCHASLARLHADQGNYLRAIHEDARALRRDFSGNRLRAFCRGIARTIAVAAGAHRPSAHEL